MKRALSAFVCVSILGVLSVGNAANTLYNKPSYRGTDTKIYPRKQEALVLCLGKGFLAVAENGLGYCKATNETVHTAPVICTNNMVLYTDDMLPPQVRAKYGNADRCLKSKAPADDPASYEEPTCGRDDSGGGFHVVVKSKADTCEKITSHEDIMQPGNPKLGNQHFLPKDLIERMSLHCPENAVMEVESNGVICRIVPRAPSGPLKK